MNIGRYEVIRELGKGGMSIVYLAQDPYIKRQVAVKVLPRSFMHDPQFRVRFQREAEIIAALEHAYIVPVYDFGEHDGEPFLIMRYLPGGTLADRLSAGPLSMDKIVPLFQSIASALDYAHDKGIIHRDIKPGNILFDSAGDASLSDFGIAKIQEATAAVTGTGDLIGTPSYISPEQAKGEKTVDGRSDIYSLGVVLFQTLSGELPFKADTPMGIAIAHIQEPVPSLLDRRPSLPPGLEEVIRRALDKDPARRYQTAAELADAIAPQGSPAEKGQATVLETPTKSSFPTMASHRKPSGWSVPVQPSVEPAPTPPYQQYYAPPTPAPAPRRSVLPRLVGVGSALLAFVICVGLIGGFVTGLIPNPFGAISAIENTAVPSIDVPTTEVVAPSPTLEPTQIAAETAIPESDPAELPTETPSAPESEITDGKGATRMVLIPAGQFTMGGGDLDAEPDEKPMHIVTLNDYYIDVFEVTNAAYKACMDEGACQPPVQLDSFTRSKYYGVPAYDEYPVVYVSWVMADTYCEWRDARLPTEAEWEKAARGADDERIYPWGTGIDCQTANYDGPNGCYGGTSMVGSYEAGKSPYGTYDMAGNVWEWVSDWFSETYYQISPVSNPLGPDMGQSHILRGGSWTRREFDVRVSNRNKYGPNYNNFDIGFRCAKDVPK